MTARDATENHRVSTPLELLFDLTFVVAVSQVAQKLAHSLMEDDVGQAIEQVVLVADVAVERHRLDPEALAELAHADGVDPALVGQVHRRPEHAVPTDRRAPFRSGSFHDRHLTSLRCSARFTA
jgi:hypothetical protein